MYARNKHSGSPIVATLEVIHGRCGIANDSFAQGPDGRLQFEDDGGGTDLFWDSAETATDDHGRIFLDRDGEHVAEADVEVVTYSELRHAGLKPHQIKKRPAATASPGAR